MISIKTFLTINVVLVVFIMVLAGSFGATYFAQQGIVKDLEKSRLDSIQRLFAVAENYFKPIMQSLESAGKDKEIMQALHNSSEVARIKASEKITDWLKKDPKSESYALYTSDCVLLAADTASWESLKSGYSARFFCEAVEQKKAAYISAFFSSKLSQQMVMAVAVPIQTNSLIIGWAVSMVPLEGLNNQFDSFLKESPNIHYHILDRERKAFLAEERGEEELEEIKEAEQIAVSKKLESNLKEGLIELNQEGDFIVFQEFEYLTIYVDETRDEVFSQLKIMQKYSLLSNVMVILILIVMIWWFGGMLTKPIEKMTRAVEEITRGKFEFRLEKSYIIEIQQLTEALNRILSSLKLAVKYAHKDEQAEVQKAAESMVGKNKNKKIMRKK